MIKINLLPFRAARKKENIRRQVSIVTLFFIFVLTAMGYYHLHLGKNIDHLNDTIKNTKSELEKYEKINEEIAEIKAKLATLQQMMGVIAALETDRRRPVQLLDIMTRVVIPKRMWFTRLQSQGGGVHIYGNALDNKTVADFMVRLEETGLFQSVELASIRQKDIKGLDLLIKEFEVNCRREPSKSAAPEKKAAKRPKFLKK